MNCAEIEAHEHRGGRVRPLLLDARPFDSARYIANERRRLAKVLDLSRIYHLTDVGMIELTPHDYENVQFVGGCFAEAASEELGDDQP